MNGCQSSCPRPRQVLGTGGDLIHLVEPQETCQIKDVGSTVWPEHMGQPSRHRAASQHPAPCCGCVPCPGGVVLGALSGGWKGKDFQLNLPQITFAEFPSFGLEESSKIIYLNRFFFSNSSYLLFLLKDIIWGCSFSISLWKLVAVNQHVPFPLQTYPNTETSITGCDGFSLKQFFSLISLWTYRSFIRFHKRISWG